MSDVLASLYPAHLAEQIRRTEAALTAADFEHLVIYSGAQHLMFLDDHYYPFKVNPLFKAWLPLVELPECFLIYSAGAKPRLVYFQPVDYWYKPPEAPSGYWVEHFDVRPVATVDATRDLLPPKLERTAFVGEWRTEFGGWGLLQVNPAALLNALHFPRAAKTPYELECMRRASALGADGHTAAERAYRAGASEYEVHMEYLRAMGQREQELPYNNIVAFNRHAAVLHYQFLDRRPPIEAERHSLLIDAGAACNGYAADITRTYAYRDRDFAELIARLDRVQQELCQAIGPRVDYKEVHLLAHRKLAGLLREADFISASADDAVASGLSGVFFPHGVGHLLGLQVHDAGGFMRDASGAQIEKPAGHPNLRLTRTLEPGFVVTVEPGIYFIDSLLETTHANGTAGQINWPRVDACRKFGGIRIEDNVAVTADGRENLTRSAFAALKR
jgi:Xaa-Pro dipeptidase